MKVEDLSPQERDLTPREVEQIRLLRRWLDGKRLKVIDWDQMGPIKHYDMNGTRLLRKA